MPRKSIALALLLVTLFAAPLGNSEPVPDYDARPPKTQSELRAWLEIMAGYYGFSHTEMSAATGLPEEEIADAVARWEIGPAERPAGRLCLVPWPGGRAVSNWGGEVEATRQRETKVGVFAPWDASSYAVLDMPEAIFSSIGLLYLAHVHVPTLWTERGIALPTLEWNWNTNGRASLERTLPNGVAYSILHVPFKNCVRSRLALTNGTLAALSGLRVQNCVFMKGMAGFGNEDAPRVVSSGVYDAMGTADGKRWVITGWIPGTRVWNNPKNPCFHSDPQFEDCPPGETRVVYGWFSFYDGGDIEAEFARIDATGWKADTWTRQPRWSGTDEPYR